MSASGEPSFSVKHRWYAITNRTQSFVSCIDGLAVKTHRCTLNSQVKAKVLERNLV
jgi:hypothetical protein